MDEKKKHETCPGCGSKMEGWFFDEAPNDSWMECPNPNCDWFADD